MRVVVLGASGLLGRCVAERLLDAGDDVVGVSRSGDGARLAAEGTAVRADLVTATDAALDALLDGAGAVVHCLGPDDRRPLPAPVAATLDRLLVAPTVNVARSARRRRVGRVVVLGSYFSTFDRLNPQWRLASRHPYVRARRDQAAQAEAASEPGTFSVLEIPFVFGAVPGVEPLWKDVLFERLRRGPVGMALPGGTAAVTAADVAQAATALVHGTAPPGRYPLVVDNLTYRHLSALVLDELGRRVPLVTFPAPVLTAGILATALGYRLRHQALGMAPRHLARDVLRRRLYLDPARCAPLGLVPGSVDQAVRATVRAAYPDRYPPGGQVTGSR